MTINASTDAARPGSAEYPALISGESTGPKQIWVEVPRADGRPAAWCYTEHRSYRPGDAVELRISSTEPRVRVRVYRDGPAEVTVHRSVHDVVFQDVPERVYAVGCDWSVTATVPCGADIEPGGYIVELATPGGVVLGHHFFVVEPLRPRHENAVALVLSTSTWTAYNDWGGANHYFGMEPHVTRGRSTYLSTQRPWARGQIWLPHGAPRMVHDQRPAEPTGPRYPFVEWAHLHGYSKYYASAGWASYERHFVRWAERQGLVLDLYTQDALHARPGLLDGYRQVVFVGHCEYWTGEMRDAVEAYTEAGGSVARFAGNFLWQIRLEDEGRTQVAYKFSAREQDPLAETDPRRMTSSWEDVRVGRPGAATFGVNAMRGMYAGFGGMAPRAARGFVVFRPDHWAFRGTGLGYADMVGDEGHVFAFEVDGLEYEFRDGLPVPLFTDGAPEGLEILAMNWSTGAEYGLAEYSDRYMLGDSDVHFRALVTGQGGSTDPGRNGRASGMIVAFRRGSGEVFTAGTCEWVSGLIRRDPHVEAITRTVLDRPWTTERDGLAVGPR